MSQSIFIMYDGVIKDPRENIINFILEDSEEVRLDNIFPISLLRSLTPQQKRGLIVCSTSFNFFEFLCGLSKAKDINKEEIQGLLDYMTSEYLGRSDLYNDLPLLVIGDSIPKLLKMSNISKIYIYTPVKDKRVIMDLIGEYGKQEKIEMVHGNIENILKEYQDISTFMINDLYVVECLKKLYPKKKLDILIPDYLYLYAHENTPVLKINDVAIEEYLKGTSYYVKLFKPVDDYDYGFVIDKDTKKETSDGKPA